jgi:hypothetical protein
LRKKFFDIIFEISNTCYTFVIETMIASLQNEAIRRVARKDGLI